MAILILGFLAVLLITFVLVTAMSVQPPMEKALDARLSSVCAGPRDESSAPASNRQLLKNEDPSSLDWLERRLQRHAFSQRMRQFILQAESSFTVSGLALGSLGLFVAGFGVAWFFAPLLPVDFAGGSALAVLPFGFLARKRSGRLRIFETVLADTIDMMARALRAGHSMQGAIEMLAENAQEPAKRAFQEVSRQQSLGLPLRDALLQLLHRVPSADLRMLVTAIMVQKDTGGNLAEILDRTAFVIRERFRIQGEIRIHTAQGRLTGWILTLLPVAMMLLLNLVNPGYSRILFDNPSGRRLIYLSIGLLASGATIIHRIVNGIEV